MTNDLFSTPTGAEFARAVLMALRDAGEAGVTSLDVANRQCWPMNRVTAALHRLAEEGAARREKDLRSGLFRYWYVQERPPRGVRLKPRKKTLRGLQITIPYGEGKSLTCNLSDARALHAELSNLLSRD